ncbi:MAG TPA: F0F1 ATP synthase subunit A [Acidobacteriota bacterium]|nr:F0F1 ATP synthase subunit A [Acidobacteriota bacterium]
MITLIVNKLALGFPVWFGQVLAVVTGDAGSAEQQADHGAAAGAPPHLPSAVWLLEEITGWDLGWAEHWINVIFAVVVALALSSVCMWVYARRRLIPGRLQNFLEILVEGMYNFVYSILGDETRKYIPFLGSLFFYILAMNWIGLVPLGHSPSTSLTITGSLAILVFLYVQYTGLRRLGVPGYLHHMAGSPRDAISWVMVPLLFPIHVIGELAKPFSLALRLFGNITGEDTLIAVFVMLGVAAMSVFSLPQSPIGIPLQVPFYFLGLLLSTIQALVFTLLSTIYILLMLPHEEPAH